MRVFLHRAPGEASLNTHYNTITRKSFFSPTRVYSGVDARLEIPKLLPAGPVLLVVDEAFASEIAVTGLNAAQVVIVRREPRETDLAMHLPAARALKPAAVVAYGGGSAIDTAKALHAEVSYGSFKTHDLDRPAGAPKLVVVPTTAGSGSETSRFFIVTDDAGLKQSYRSWSYAPDLAVLDPFVLRNAGERRLVLGAFDAFMHLWETYVCRTERDPVARVLALEGITLIARALCVLEAGRNASDEELTGLQRASAFGGMCIANVRTGLIHTLGESLAQQIDLSHPETIYIFFEAAVEQYTAAIQKDIELLDLRLRVELGGDWSLTKLRATWRALFERLGIEAHIEEALSAHAIDLPLLLSTVGRDRVLLKENPAPLTPEIIADVAASRLHTYAVTNTPR